MSKTEKVVVISVILLILTGISFSYYNKIYGNQMIIDFAEKNYNPENMISERKTVNINIADKDTLTKLSGIGTKLAQRIIDYRRKNLKFNSPDELMKIEGIGPKKYEAIKKYLRVK